MVALTSHSPRETVAMLKGACTLAVMLTMAACSGSKTSTPTTPSPTTFTLTGQVTDSATGTAISTATVSIADGPNAAKSSTTDGSGNYSVTGLQQSGFTVNASANNYV